MKKKKQEAPSAAAASAAARRSSSRPEDEFDWDSLVDTPQQLVNELLSPDRIHGVPTEMRDPAILKDHLVKVLFPENNSRLKWLLEPLIKGLLEGGDAINVRLHGRLDTNLPLLHLVCSWNFLLHFFDWQGKDDMVSMVLATPGVDVNACNDEGHDAAYPAVQFGSTRTLELLSEGGIDINHRLLPIALHRAKPEILRAVLGHLQARELFWVSSSEQEPFTAADIFFGTYGNLLEKLHGNALSDSERMIVPHWTNEYRGDFRGPPSIENFAACLILLLQHGSYLTNRYLPDALTYRFLLDALKSGPTSSGIMDQLLDCIFGLWLPPFVQRQIEEIEQARENRPLDESNGLSSEICFLCSNPLYRETILYCGHSFCRRCILDYAKAGETHCKLCRHRLCRDIFPEGGEENVHYESTLLSVVLADGQKTSPPIQESEVVASADSVSSPKLELSATQKSLAGTGLRWLTPADGPVLVQIFIKGVPVLAQISNNSRFTLISASVVKNFNLVRLSRLTSQSLQDAFTGDALENTSLTCLESLTFSIEGVEVTLRNALEVNPDMKGVGVQLGQDFFQSASACCVIVKVRDGSNSVQLMALDGHETVGPYLPNQAPERALHYVAASSDEATRARLLHGSPDRQGRLIRISPKPGKVLKECNWCTRLFTKGMFYCTQCKEEGFYVYYCSEKCHEAAWKVHTKTHHVW
jgi:hypothetical protein